MKKALVIGAGYFGKHLVFELLEGGFAVDVIDKDEAPSHILYNSGCRYIEKNAWNLPFMKEIQIPDYDCCFVCLGENKSMSIHVVEELRKGGARSIVVRVKRMQDAEMFLKGGADKAVCPAQIAGAALVRELLNQE